MFRKFFSTWLLLVSVCLAQANLRAPAVPLVTHDPYFCIWSMGDVLTDDWTKHWTGTPHAMVGMVRVDGRTYRWCGPHPVDAPAARQVSVEVRATQTVYVFHAGGVQLQVTFTTPCLLHDLELASRPISYISFEAQSVDAAEHRVSLYWDVAGEAAVNNRDQSIIWGDLALPDLHTKRFSSQEQPVLAKKGDNLRIDWGHLYISSPKAHSKQRVGGARLLRQTYLVHGDLPERDDPRQPRHADDDLPVAACVLDLGSVSAGKSAKMHVCLGYDDIDSLTFLDKPLKAWWCRKGLTYAQALAQAYTEAETVLAKCAAFDQELRADLEKCGGEKYADIAELSFRQFWSAHKLVAAPDGTTPWFLSKENFSNGCIGTVDVLYPAFPACLLFNLDLAKGEVDPIMVYAQSDKWKYPYAPHDLGTYPRADGQVYGMGEKDGDDARMPVEECGNMLLCLAAIAHAEGSTAYAEKYWPLLEKWAAYLLTKGFDPENQLCTDDFAGHLAHNANLSIKAILALAAFGQMAEKAGKTETAAKYSAAAKAMMPQWIQAAKDGAGHYRLAFDREGSWSQKYNLVWDRLLGLHVFPPDVASTEVAHYLKVQNHYGLPLDSRKTYTKLDWLVWSATLTQKRSDFDALLLNAWNFVHETPNRVPLTDWYETKEPRQVGFQARSVVGGIFIPLLSHPELCQKWRGKKN